jgi:hypothetical protein
MTETSLKRIEANRQNAQKSTGPKNQTSTRYNAVKHGLLAEGVTELDDTENFVGLCEQLEEEYVPVGLVEAFLVRRIALCMIRLRRACLFEAEFVTADLNPTITRTIEKNAYALMLEDIDPPHEVELIDPGLPAHLSANTVEELVNKFQRYETAIESKLYRAINQLETLKQMRQGAAKPGEKTIKTVTPKRKQLASFGNSPSQK